MSDLNFRQVFPQINEVTEWYLEEIVYCLEHYAAKDRENAYEAVLTSDNLVRLLTDHHHFIQAESPFYWAMGIAHGFNSLWWQNKDLWAQRNEYVNSRYHPPSKKG